MIRFEFVKSMRGIEDLMQALANDKALAEKLSSAGTPEEAVKVAEAAGYTISKNELLEAYKAKMATMSEEELANVAGGKNDSSGGNQQNQSDSQGDIHQNGGNAQGNVGM